MNITDELREFVRGADGYELWCPRHKAELLAIADRIDTALIANGYVELPKDRDGEYVRVGDRMQVCDTGTVFNVTLLRLINSGWVVNPVNFMPSDLRHYHAPTVEELLDQLEGLRGNGADYEDVVTRASEIAEKLRELLKEDA